MLSRILLQSASVLLKNRQFHALCNGYAMLKYNLCLT